MTGGVTQEEAEGALTFTIQNETTGEYFKVEADGTTSWTETETELTLAELSRVEGYSVTGSAENGFLFEVVLDEVEAGQYMIIEKNSAIEGFETKTTSVTSGSEELAAMGEIQIDLKDDYEAIKTGKLTFTKTVTGGVTEEEAKGALTFVIHNETTGEYLSVGEDGTISWTDTEKNLTLGELSRLDGYSVTGSAENGFLFTVVLEDVEQGRYIITEENSDIEGFETKTTSINTGSGELAALGELQIDLRDDYEEITRGSLVFIKTVTGGVTQEEAEGALTFTIQNETTGKYLAVSEAGETSWVDEETELTLKELSKTDGYTVTSDAEDDLLFKVVLEDVRPAVQGGTGGCRGRHLYHHGEEQRGRGIRSDGDICHGRKQRARGGQRSPDQPEG